jgi:methyl-accepting chemotaxis protein
MSQSLSSATEHQTMNAKKVSKAVTGISKVTQSAGSAAQEMSSAAGQPASFAQGLQKMRAQFKIATAQGLSSCSTRKAAASA